ncbi:response regulator [Pseudorhodoferax aquiterrae]|uniref:Response regulator n=1 Tax=Pseudorhodoferax aquiterrae TaxID=747304 RepID=A0ABQ3GAB7_9BURK|nr:response regulator [Pseudorhodoferax aquiterrae]GHC98338.1 response regulator [Pseudorhodoferax aquiterrae]
MSKPIILIVDDEHDSADLLGMLLEMHFPDAGFFVAYGGREALDHATSQRPVAAVLDLEMPGMNGESLAHALRQKFVDRPPLLIALSGNVLLLSQIRANGAFDHHLSKPADTDALVHLLREQLAS